MTPSPISHFRNSNPWHQIWILIWSGSLRFKPLSSPEPLASPPGYHITTSDHKYSCSYNPFIALFRMAVWGIFQYPILPTISFLQHYIINKLHHLSQLSSQSQNIHHPSVPQRYQLLYQTAFCLDPQVPSRSSYTTTPIGPVYLLAINSSLFSSLPSVHLQSPCGLCQWTEYGLNLCFVFVTERILMGVMSVYEFIYNNIHIFGM